RGLARVELRQFQHALADFDQALALGRTDAFLHAGRGAALEALGESQQADAAFRQAFAGATTLPAAGCQRLLWVYGFAVARRLPDKAGEAFAEVLRQQPNNPQALYGRGMLLVEEGHSEAALALFTRASEADPRFVDPRRARAVLLARKGQLTQATEDVN